MPIIATLTLIGIGCGVSVDVGSTASCSPRFSIRAWPVRSARFIVSQTSGWESASSASMTRKPPFARCSAPGLIIVWSVTTEPSDGR